MRTQATVHAENGLVDVDGLEHLPSSSPAALQGTGLVMVIWPKLYLRTGIAMGPVLLELESLDAAPDADVGDWEDVVEFTAVATGEPVTLHGATEFALGDVVIDSQGAAEVRVRLSATGRGLARDLVVDEACERYLVQLWPAKVGEHEVDASISDPIRRSGTASGIGPESVSVDDGPRPLR